MNLYTSTHEMSHLQLSSISVNNVYDFAYDIAQEFEKIVFLYGIDKVRPVVDKVINVLEILEASIKKIEQLEVELEDLKSNSLHLSSEKIVNDHEKSKLKQIYEESEESWLAEVVSLKSQLSALKSENELLKNHLAVKKESYSKSDDVCSNVIEDQENVICKLKRIIKQKEKQLQDNAFNINALNSRIQELLDMNKILHTKNQEAKNEINQLILEKNDYKSELILQKRENMLLGESLDELIHSSTCVQEESNIHLSGRPTLNEDSLEEDILHYRRREMKLLEKIKRLQSELQYARSKSQQCEENISKFGSAEKKITLSKIHQFFHLFLGVTTISEFCWF